MKNEIIHYLLNNYDDNEKWSDLLINKDPIIRKSVKKGLDLLEDERKLLNTPAEEYIIRNFSKLVIIFKEIYEAELQKKALEKSLN